MPSRASRQRAQSQRARGFFLAAQDLGQVHHKLLVYGPSGVSKTMGTIMSSADMGRDPSAEALVGDPTVAVLATEKQSIQSIKLGNPQALVKVVETIGDVSPMDQVREFLDLAMTGELAAIGVKRIVIDGITEIQQMIKDEIAGPGEIFTLQDWGELKTRMRRLLRTLRALDYHVICTALQLEERSEGRVTRIVPGVEGKSTPGMLTGFFQAVGYAQRQRGRRAADGKRVTSYVTFWEADSLYDVKSCIPLTGTTPTCGGHWVEVLDGLTAPAEVAAVLSVDAPVETPGEPEGEEEEAAPKA